MSDTNAEEVPTKEITLEAKLEIPASMPEDVFMDLFLKWVEARRFVMTEGAITYPDD